ncbi:MAG TPA: polysaccharide pyruvyl transferase family protein [Trichocoleus sp.]|jgi:polysaccharide pyruvyl transferase WcaK-like protein
MKIAVFGYYNSLNAGDDRIQYSITKLMEGNTIIFLPHYLSPPREYLETFDWILIGGGGLVFERVGIWVDVRKWLRYCKAKIGILGLGVNCVTEELEPELSSLIEASEFFYVRDDESKRLLNQHAHVEVHPDLTWCFPVNSEASATQEQGIALNLLPCHWKEFNHNAWIESLSSFQTHPFPFHFGQNRDFSLLRHYFGDKTPSEFSLQPLIKSKLLVACRYHAIVFAMQMGKPFIAINYDEKVKRLLEESDLMECCLETTEHHLLPNKIQFVLDHQIELQNKIDRFATLEKERAKHLRNKVQSYTAISSHPANDPVMFSIKSIAKRYLGQS